jgi:ubiquinone biosynthesis protein Coq4
MGPIMARLSKDPAVAQALAERHRVRVSLDELARLPSGTLGRDFADHMRAANLDPSAIPTLPSDNATDFVRAHLYETHDVWHVVTGFATDYVSELGLQAFYYAQIPGPLPALLLATGFVRGAILERDILDRLGQELYRGYHMGREAKPLFGVRWDELWSVPLVEVRRRLGVVVEGETLRAVPAAA